MEGHLVTAHAIIEPDAIASLTTRVALHALFEVASVACSTCQAGHVNVISYVPAQAGLEALRSVEVQHVQGFTGSALFGTRACAIQARIMAEQAS